MSTTAESHRGKEQMLCCTLGANHFPGVFVEGPKVYFVVNPEIVVHECPAEHIHTHRYVCICVHVDVCIYTHACAYIYIYIYMCMCIV